MSRAAALTKPVVMDVTVTLTAIVRPEPDAGGYSASIPALPGCHTQGETLDEIRTNLREAAEGWLAVAHDDSLARDATTSRRTVVPVHGNKDLKPGTQRGIMHDAGLTDDDL